MILTSSWWSRPRESRSVPVTAPGSFMNIKSEKKGQKLEAAPRNTETAVNKMKSNLQGKEKKAVRGVVEDCVTLSCFFPRISRIILN